MRAYKVVIIRDREGIRTATSWYPMSSVEYTFGKVTKRKEGWGHLTAFPNIEDCILFIFINSFVTGLQCAILECEVEETKDKEKGLWYYRGTTKITQPKENTPNNTIYCDSITPIKVCHTILSARDKQRLILKYNLIDTRGIPYQN